jgi:HPt (histidine-containing phosphotransfer) domain-containing protein
MNENDCKVIVQKDLEDLIPVFMRNRHKELDSLRAALAAADFEQLRQLGHRMKGVGNSYGFTTSRRSASTSRTARARRPRSLQARISEYEEYLSKVQITYE